MAKLIIKDREHAQVITEILRLSWRHHKDTDDAEVLQAMKSLADRLKAVGEGGLAVQIPQEISGEMLSRITHGAQASIESIIMASIR